MTMGRRKDVQGELLICPAELPDGGGHVFYDKLNQLLSLHEYDRKVETLCEQYFDDGSRCGRPRLPPSVYFRMCIIGYFEGIVSHRGIAWRCDAVTSKPSANIQS